MPINDAVVAFLWSETETILFNRHFAILIVKINKLLKTYQFLCKVVVNVQNKKIIKA